MNTKLIAKNPVAYHNYNIEDKIEAGIVLSGTEIKSIRNGKVNLKDSYANIKNGECYIYGMHISPYEYGNIFNKDPLRDRKLLLNKREIDKLYGLIKQKGYKNIYYGIYLIYINWSREFYVNKFINNVICVFRLCKYGRF